MIERPILGVSFFVSNLNTKGARVPYITPERRDQLSKDENVAAENPGELNYVFTEVALDYLRRRGTSYQTINDIIGALEGAKLEFYRRVAAPYEFKKMTENGDVFPKED